MGGGELRRGLFGYRRVDVEAALAARDAALADLRQVLAVREEELGRRVAELEDARVRLVELERVASRLSERVVGRERELAAARAELARLRAESEEAIAGLRAITAELEAVREQARSQATRIRLRALRDAGELTNRIAELSQRPAAARERLLEALADAIRRLGGEVEPATAGANGHREGAEPEDVFEGMVELEVGPLSDFAQLVGFEDAASGIGATSEISVKRFTKGRATLELHLGEPVELLRELEERAPFEFRVRDTRDDRLILDVDE